MKKKVEWKMRSQKDWKTVTIVLTYDDIEFVDSVAGPGHRSEYIRNLIRNQKGDLELETIRLEEENKVLTRLLQDVKEENRKLRAKVNRLKEKRSILEQRELEDIARKYAQWKQELQNRLGSISTELKLTFLEPRARSLGIKPRDLYRMLEQSDYNGENSKRK